jgi:hypothetical protein
MVFKLQELALLHGLSPQKMVQKCKFALKHTMFHPPSNDVCLHNVCLTRKREYLECSVATKTNLNSI